MKDQITEIELNLEYSKLTMIVHNWATEIGFSIHEKTEKRIVYSDKRQLLGAKWISIENLGTITKLSAWISPKGLGPDQKGNFWKGNKVPVPTGFVTGSPRRFKEQFNDLLARLNNVSNEAPVSLKTLNANATMASKEDYAKGLLVLAIIIFGSGALSALNGVNSITNQLSPTFANSLLQDGIIDMVLGIVVFTSSRLLKSGKALSIWLYGATVLFSIGQDLAIGAKFPFFTVIFSVWAISQLVGLKKQGQLV